MHQQSVQLSVARNSTVLRNTPILQHNFAWKRLSAIPGLSFCYLYFEFSPDTFRAELIIELLSPLKRRLKRPLFNNWEEDVSTHPGRNIRAWIEAFGGSTHLCAFGPLRARNGFGQDALACLKKPRISYICFNTIGEVNQFAHNRLKFVLRRIQLVASFWKPANLAI